MKTTKKYRCTALCVSAAMLSGYAGAEEPVSRLDEIVVTGTKIRAHIEGRAS